MRYQPHSTTTITMTPGGILCYQQWSKGEKPFIQNGIKWIGRTNDFDYKKNANLYMHFHSSQFIMNVGAKAWSEYNTKTMVIIARSQNNDGSWSIPGGANNEMRSIHYATCLSTLIMEAYYR